MTSKIFAPGERVSVTNHDWALGEQALPGAVRRMTSETHLVIDLDMGFSVGAHVADVERLVDETQSDRRAA